MSDDAPAPTPMLLRQSMEDAHGTGLRLAGYHAALDDLSILLATEVERRESWGDYGDYGGTQDGLRWALKAIEGMRP